MRNDRHSGVVNREDPMAEAFDKTRNFQGDAEGGIRTHTRLPSAVFETAASAIPPLRHVHILYGPQRVVSTHIFHRHLGIITNRVSVLRTGRCIEQST